MRPDFRPRAPRMRTHDQARPIPGRGRKGKCGEPLRPFPPYEGRTGWGVAPCRRDWRRLRGKPQDEMRPTRSDASGRGSGGKRSGASAFVARSRSAASSPTSPPSTQARHRPPGCDPEGCAAHSTDEELARDVARTVALAAQGSALLRFAGDEVLHNLERMLETIRLKLTELEAAHRGYHGLSLARSPSCPRPTGHCRRANAFRLRLGAKRRQSRRHGATPYPFLPPQGGRNASAGSPRPSPTNGCVNLVGLNQSAIRSRMFQRFDQGRFQCRSLHWPRKKGKFPASTG